MKRRIKINFTSDVALPKKWAWNIATRLPWQVHNACVMIFLASCGAYARNGLDATVRELMAELRQEEESSIRFTKSDEEENDD